MSYRISSLPDDCIQLIFDRIPTQHLFTVRRVCHAWQNHQQLNCRTRKSLIILQGRDVFNRFINRNYTKPFLEHNIDHNGNTSNNRFFIGFNSISISYEHNPNVKFLVETFLHLRTLIVLIQIVSSANLRAFSDLITRHTSKLTTLKLYFDAEFTYGLHKTPLNKIMANLINQLNSFTQLSHLSFQIHDPHGKFYLRSQIEEPQFLTRIKELYFDFDCLEKIILNWVQKCVNAGRLDQLERFYLKAFSIDKIVKDALIRIITVLPSLITFRCTLGMWAMLQKSHELKSLTKLVHVHLDVNVPSKSQPLNSYPQLKALTALDLSCRYNKPEHLPSFCQTQVSTIVYCYPNLQSIRITVVFDYYYYYYDRDFVETNVKQFFDQLKVAYGKESLRTEYFPLK